MIEDFNRNCELDVSPFQYQVGGHTFQKDSNSLGMLLFNSYGLIQCDSIFRLVEREGWVCLEACD